MGGTARDGELGRLLPLAPPPSDASSPRRPSLLAGERRQPGPRRPRCGRPVPHPTGGAAGPLTRPPDAAVPVNSRSGAALSPVGPAGPSSPPAPPVTADRQPLRFGRKPRRRLVIPAWSAPSSVAPDAVVLSPVVLGRSPPHQCPAPPTTAGHIGFCPSYSEGVHASFG